jgi:uncharacterized phosphosugar-binding protein
MELDYINVVRDLVDTIATQERHNMEQAVGLLFDCVSDHHSIWAFGASHAGILTEELFYRAGGLALVNPIFGRELMPDTQPVSTTSKMERLVGYGTELARSRADFSEGDVLIVHSVSGRNPAAIEVALAARGARCSIVAVTSLAYSRSVSSRHPSGKRLFELADVILDNHGVPGDAAVSIPGLDQRVGPTSTIAGALMLNAVVVELVRRLVDSGMSDPPVLYSANLEGGDALNQRIAQRYADSIHYRF